MSDQDLTIDDLLGDPFIQQLMRADKVSMREITSLLKTAADGARCTELAQHTHTANKERPSLITG